MTNGEKLLCSITESADMATDSLNKVIDKTNDQELVQELENQCEDYQKYYEMAAEMLREMGKEPKKTSAFPKIFAGLSADMKTMNASDKPSEIAKMVVEGSTMGVTEVTQKLHDYDGDDQRVKQFAQRFIKDQQKHIDSVKRFL